MLIQAGLLARTLSCDIGLLAKTTSLLPDLSRSCTLDNAASRPPTRPITLSRLCVSLDAILDAIGDDMDIRKPLARRGYSADDYLALDGLTTTIAAGQHTRAFGRGSVPGPFGIDPPRPARDGFEWVWFPEGYWAEREFLHPLGGARRSGSKSSDIKVWSRWRRRSAKSRSSGGGGAALESESTRDSPSKHPGQSLSMFGSATSHLGSTTSPSPMTPGSPFLTEQAHVHSLQHPPSLLQSN